MSSPMEASEQITQSSPMSADSPPAISCLDHLTADGKDRINKLKPQASTPSDEKPPTEPGTFILWRLAAVEEELALIRAYKTELREINNLSDPGFIHARDQADDEESSLLEEEVQLLENERLITQDLKDSLYTAEKAYLMEIYPSYRISCKAGQKIACGKGLRREKFAAMITTAYDAAMTRSDGAEYLWCCVRGGWFLKRRIMCAHIVPMSFNSKDLGYIFGAGDAALLSDRNGLMMGNVIEVAFSYSWLVIVPDDTVETNPTQWKLVLLYTLIKDVPVSVTDEGEVLRLKDLDGRRLIFRNNHRPARRYLFFRYVMALMTARDRKWPGWREKVPPGTIWASPNKPEGYLRRSALWLWAREVGETDQYLPEDLLAAGTFDDTTPPTHDATRDRVTAIKLSLAFRRKNKGQDESERESESDGES